VQARLSRAARPLERLGDYDHRPDVQLLLGVPVLRLEGPVTEPVVPARHVQGEDAAGLADRGQLRQLFGRGEAEVGVQVADRAAPGAFLRRLTPDFRGAHTLSKINGTYTQRRYAILMASP